MLRSAGLTFVRVNAALLIGALWTVPVGVAIGSSPRLARIAQPQAVNADQDVWLAQRNACASAACLTRSYRQHIQDLQAWTRRVQDFAHDAFGEKLRRLRVRLEDKEAIAGLHWRGVPDEDEARHQRRYSPIRSMMAWSASRLARASRAQRSGDQP